VFVCLFVTTKDSGLHEANIRLLEPKWRSHVNEISFADLLMANFSRNTM